MSPLGPFVDTGVNLTPEEPFAIDAHPFRDVDGSWYLFFARDVLDGPRPGTQLAVKRMTGMTSVEEMTTSVLAAGLGLADLRARATHVRARARLAHAGGSDGGAAWRRATCCSSPADRGRATATASRSRQRRIRSAHGRIEPAPEPDVLSTAITGLVGPGHNSILRASGRDDLIAYHAWNETAHGAARCTWSRSSGAAIVRSCAGRANHRRCGARLSLFLVNIGQPVHQLVMIEARPATPGRAGFTPL